MNCIIVDDEKSSRVVLQKMVEKVGFLNIVASCESATEALEVLEKKEIDIMFLDIEMPEISGFDLLNSLKVKPVIILVTSKAEYAIQAFEYEVEDYLVKPVEYSRFLKAIIKAKESVEFRKSELASNSTKSIFAKVDSRYIRLPLQDILFIEAEGDYMVIHCEHDKFVVYSTLRNVENKLPKDQFIKVHRSYIVRIDKISDFNSNNIVIGKHVIPISLTCRAELMQTLNII